VARDQPVVVTIGGTESLERAGWKRTLDDTVGELGVRVLGAGRMPSERAEAIAAGWGGDRLRALARGNDLILVWMTAWDSVDDAQEFASALPAVTDGARVERRDDRVLVLLGPSAGAPDMGALAAATWKKTGFARLPAPAP
jgi:hypothetical protein